MVKNSGDTGSIPGPGRSHTLQAPKPRVPQYCAHAPGPETAAAEAPVPQSSLLLTKKSPSLATRGQAPRTATGEKPERQGRPSTAKSKYIEFKERGNN